MPNEANPVDPTADSEMVKSLLGRQDEVIAELDLLADQILNVIEDLVAQRKSEDGEDGDEVADVVPMESVDTKSANEQPLPKAA